MMSPSPAFGPGKEAFVTIHSATIRPAAVHAHGELVRAITGIATAVLVVASTVALGTVGTEAAVLAIVILSPVVLLGSAALVQDA
ncbi:MAG TPA: hypothetical protein VD838_18555 [Anaeromyxobacteraceae bacterium]|nr:hypothetical protein [Anaeromyxobacteraceae bacterium]